MSKICGVRLEPEEVLAIVKHYGSFTKFVREKIKRDKKLRAKNGNAKKN